MNWIVVLLIMLLSNYKGFYIYSFKCSTSNLNLFENVPIILDTYWKFYITTSLFTYLKENMSPVLWFFTHRVSIL